MTIKLPFALWFLLAVMTIHAQDRTFRIDSKFMANWNGTDLYGLHQISSKGYFGLEDSKGTLLCNPRYDHISNFLDGYAIVQLDGLYGLIDQKGQEAVCGSNSSLIVVRI